MEPGRSRRQGGHDCGSHRRGEKRNPRVFLTLDDRTGRIEVTLFEDVYVKYRDCARTRWW